MEKTNKKKFSYGGHKIDILYQKSSLIPTEAFDIKLPSADKEAIAIAMVKDLPALFVGEAGTGKTSIVRYLAYKRKQGYTRINMHGYNTPDELIGSKSVKNGSTYYEQGILTDAMIRGHMVVLDEINATPPDCMFILHGLLDEDKRISLPNGDIIRPHKDFRFFATMNPDYEGTRGLNRAFLDRFAVVLDIEVLKPAKERKLLKSRLGINEELIEKMVTVAWMARKAYNEQKTMLCISTRTLLHWGNLILNGISPEVAYVKAIANKSRKDERLAFTDFYHAVFKSAADSVDNDTPILTTKGEIKRLEQQATNFRESYEKKVEDLEKIQEQIYKVESKLKRSVTKITHNKLRREKVKLEIKLRVEKRRVRKLERVPKKS